MVDIETMSVEEIQKVLTRKQAEKELKAAPQVKKNIDWSAVINMAEEERDAILSGEYRDSSDFRHFLYEEVMKAVFGNKYFDWHNKRVR